MSYRSEIGFREDPYNECAKIALKVRQKSKHYKKVERNTYIEWNDVFDGVFYLRLHATRVLEFHADGRVVLNSGGWRTVTTKDRMNRFLPLAWHVGSNKGVWFLYKKIAESYYVHKGTRERKSNINYSADDYEKWDLIYSEYQAYTFEDFITIHADGSVSGHGGSPDEQFKLGKQIRKYARDFAKAFVEGKVPAPSDGDCSFCSMIDKNGKPIGEAMSDNEHLLMHIKEKYYVPSLLVRASNTVGTSQYYKQKIFNWMTIDMKFMTPLGRTDTLLARDIRSVLSSYLLSRFGQAQRRTCFASAA